MPPELELVRQWLERASADLRAAKILATDTSLTSEVCFHGQQAVEKALKAYLTFAGIEFEYVHSIVYLLDLSAEGEGGFEQFRPSADALTQHAVPLSLSSIGSQSDSRRRQGSLVRRRTGCRVRPEALTTENASRRVILALPPWVPAARPVFDASGAAR
jgi:HEPN domain-containing protein